MQQSRPAAHRHPPSERRGGGRARRLLPLSVFLLECSFDPLELLGQKRGPPPPRSERLSRSAPPRAQIYNEEVRDLVQEANTGEPVR